jgi:hypothetical protein
VPGPVPEALRRTQSLGPGGRGRSDFLPDGRYAVVVRRDARSILSSSRNRGRQGSPYPPAWESEVDYLPNCHASTPISSRSGRNCAGGSLEVTWTRNNIVRSGKPHRLLCEISYRGLIVPPGKRYRPCEETLSSCPGTNIVLPRNLYRPLREPISSHWGKVIVPLRKYAWLFPANMPFLLHVRLGGPVIVHVKCLLCVYR